jgi:p-aminobenzoyl-glutamate transporter AbgT
MLLFEHCAMMFSYVIAVYVFFLILTHTWFAFGLPSKTGCDT